MDSLLIGLISMVVAFIVIYLFLSKRVDQTDYTHDITSNQSSRRSLRTLIGRLGLDQLKKKSKIISYFKSLEKSDQEDVINKLNDILSKK